MPQTYILDSEDPLTTALEEPADIFTPLTPTQLEHNREVYWYRVSGYLSKTPIS